MSDELQKEIAEWSSQIFTKIKYGEKEIELIGVAVSPDHGTIFLQYYDEIGHLRTVFARDCVVLSGEKISSVYDKLWRNIDELKTKLERAEAENERLKEETLKFFKGLQTILQSGNLAAMKEVAKVLEKELEK